MSLSYETIPSSVVVGPKGSVVRTGRGARAALRLTGVAASLAILVYLVGDMDLAGLFAVTGSLPVSAVALAALALALNVAGSVVRLRFVLADFGFSLSRARVASAAIFGTIGGVLFLQFVGQTLTRFAVLRDAGVPGSATLLVSLYERAVSTLVLAVLAGAGLFQLFGNLTLDLDGGGFEFIRLATSALCAVLFGASIGYAPLLRRALGQIAHRRVGLRILRAAAVTLAIQLAMLAAYVLLANAVAPQAGILELCAASAIVMFAAALPISFGGWGVRELSAVAAYGAIGIGPAESLTVSVTIGVFSQLILFVIAGILSFGSAHKHRRSAEASNGAASGAGLGIDYFALLAMGLPLAAATAVLFQVRVPVGGGELSVNLADPLVVVGALACIAGWIGTRSARERWRLAALEPALAAFSLVIAAGFLHGALRIGITDWALFNRLIGWVMLIAYALTGAMITSQYGVRGTSVLLRTLVAVAAAVVVSDCLFYGFDVVGAALGPMPPRMEAMAANPNAFGYQMMIAAAILIAVPHLGLRRSGAVAALLAALVIGSIWLSGSRASVGTLAITATIALALGIARPLGVARLLGLATIPIILFYLAAVFGSTSETFGVTLTSGLRTVNSVGEQLDVERWASIAKGIDLWLHNPLFGGGLGAFYASHLDITGTPLIIHSTPVWLLAEFGVIGTAIVAGTAGWAVWSLWKAWRAAPRNPALAIAILVIVVMVAEFAVHDMLYQRIFWLVLGACLAQPAARRRSVVHAVARKEAPARGLMPDRLSLGSSPSCAVDRTERSRT